MNTKPMIVKGLVPALAMAAFMSELAYPSRDPRPFRLEGSTGKGARIRLDKRKKLKRRKSGNHFTYSVEDTTKD